MYRIYINRNNPTHRDVISAFADGMEPRFELVQYNPSGPNFKRPSEGDKVIIFGIQNDHMEERVRASQIIDTVGIENCLIIELGFIDRRHSFMVGWGGLNGRADFRTEGVEGDRWGALRTELQPIRTDGDYILVAGQVYNDSTIKNVDFQQWANETCEEIAKHTDKPIIFRRHPLDRHFKAPQGTIRSDIKLNADLQRSCAVVTYSSNLGVDAVVAGLPVYAADKGSMVYNLANKSLNNIDKWTLDENQRVEWAHKLAYSQWSCDEMRRGLPHKRLGIN